MIHRSPLFNGHEFDLGRVTVFLGANGTGKSRLLNEIKAAQAAVPNTKVVYVEGGRAIKIDNEIKFSPQTYQRYDRLEASEKFYERKRASSLADRVFDAIVVLEQKGIAITRAHSDAVEEWRTGGQSGSCPVRIQPPLEKVFEIFSEIFPDIRLRFESNGRRLFATKNDIDYGPSELSDGEKQVFSMLADLLALDGSHKWIIVDEPELNLHPALAERLWSLIETEFPEKNFLYATHSINFAMRDEVDAVYVLSKNAGSITRISNIAEVPRESAEDFLGNLPGLLAFNKVLVTEGAEGSFDSILYRWVLGDSTVGIHPAGDCHHVRRIVSRSGLWDQISTGIALIGVIDADYYPSQEADGDLLVLRFHEAESMLCHPAVIVRVAEILGHPEGNFDFDRIVDVVLYKLRECRLDIAARRVIARSSLALNLSVARVDLEGVRSEEQLVSNLLEAADSEVRRAAEGLGRNRVEGLVAEELQSIDAAIASRDVNCALRFLPGKSLLNQLARLVGLGHSRALARFVSANMSPQDFPHLFDLQQELNNRFKCSDRECEEGVAANK